MKGYRPFSRQRSLPNGGHLDGTKSLEGAESLLPKASFLANSPSGGPPRSSSADPTGPSQYSSLGGPGDSGELQQSQPEHAPATTSARVKLPAFAAPRFHDEPAAAEPANSAAVSTGQTTALEAASPGPSQSSSSDEGLGLEGGPATGSAREPRGSGSSPRASGGSPKEKRSLEVAAPAGIEPGTSPYTEPESTPTAKSRSRSPSRVKSAAKLKPIRARPTGDKDSRVEGAVSPSEGQPGPDGGSEAEPSGEAHPSVEWRENVGFERGSENASSSSPAAGVEAESVVSRPEGGALASSSGRQGSGAAAVLNPGAKV